MVEGLACTHSRFIVLHHYQLRYKFLLNNKPYGTIYIRSLAAEKCVTAAINSNFITTQVEEESL